MDEMRKRAYAQLVVRVTLTRAAAVFLAAWTFHYWQAWLMLGVNAIGEATTTHYLIRHDRDLLRRRLQMGADAEQSKDRRTVQVILRLATAGVLVVCGLDHRYGWSHLAAADSIAADVLVAAGMLIIGLTFRANSFASSIVELGADQRVICTGPYAFVRHPMYTGLIVTIVGMGPALGSWWGLLGAAVFGAGIVVRLREEELFLSRNLAGYEDYRKTVRRRLAPLVW
jgi:protein-S-isoprenylcysteine O-methyltransferase Ste14